VQNTSKKALDSKDTAGVDRIDLLMSTPMPAQMVLRLAAMAIDPDNTLSKCTIKGAVFTSDVLTPNSDSPGQAAEAQYKEMKAVVSFRDYGAVLDELFVLLQQHKADEFYKLLQERRESLQPEEWKALVFVGQFCDAVKDRLPFPHEMLGESAEWWEQFFVLLPPHIQGLEREDDRWE